MEAAPENPDQDRLQKRLENLKKAREALAEKRKKLQQDREAKETPAQTPEEKPMPSIISPPIDVTPKAPLSRKALEEKNPWFDWQKRKTLVPSYLPSGGKQLELEERLKRLEEKTSRKRKRQAVELEDERLAQEEEALQAQAHSIPPAMVQPPGVSPAQAQLPSSAPTVLSTLGITTIQVLGAVALLFISIAGKNLAMGGGGRRSEFSGPSPMASAPSSSGFSYYR